MNLLHTCEVTLHSLRTRAIRSVLASLGVVLGVGAVVGMLAVGEGARRESLGRIQSLGVDNLIIRAVRPLATARQDTAGAATASALDAYGFTERDLIHLRTRFANVRQVVPVRNLRKTVYARGRPTDLILAATTPAFLDVTRSRLADPRGRWLSALDGEAMNLVCVLGRTAADRLFGAADPLGEAVSVGGMQFRVVGVVASEASVEMAGGGPINNMVILHLRTAAALFGTILTSPETNRLVQVEADAVYVAVRDTAALPDTAARLRAYLGVTHDQGDCQLLVPYELLEQEKATRRMFTIVTGAIAAISLLVGGIGIMNIMLANIFERTREIGILRALGARRSHILGQFLLESVMLTGLGGLAGIALGAGIAAAVERTAGMKTVIAPDSLLLALAVAVLTGLLFGTYPAWKAASLSPVEALRR
ncbi:MAG: ABC transporter permease [Lentisphaeria bacterium]|jgi:putative ABC transport system permease protein